MTSPVHSGTDVGAPTDRTTSQRPRDARPGRTSQAEPAPDGRGLQAPARASKVYAAEKWLLRRLLRRLGNPAIGVALWDGQQLTTSERPPVATVRIHDRRTLLGLIVNPEVHFGDAYTDGRIEVDGDLLALLQTVFRAMWPMLTATGSLRGRLWYWLGRLHSNTTGRARRNVYHHYDIKGDFYRLWLDEQRVYTCAYFPDPAMTIEEAQRAKLDYVCRKLRLREGETAVEAGCGWGALALHMARHYGVTVKAYNLSHEQTLFSRQRAKAEGLSSRVEFIEDDYRNVSGRFDAFVSVGMLEHVGLKHYPALGDVIDRCLKPDGRGLIHSIGRNEPARCDAWIQRRIFPGAYPPTLREMMDVLEPHGFSVLDVENLRLHYARTLEHWLARFQTHEQEVAEMFDERFVRMWRLYLTGSMSGFTSGTLQLFQILFARSDLNEIPWTRAGLYAEEE